VSAPARFRFAGPWQISLALSRVQCCYPVFARFSIFARQGHRPVFYTGEPLGSAVTRRPDLCCGSVLCRPSRRFLVFTAPCSRLVLASATVCFALVILAICDSCSCCYLVQTSGWSPASSSMFGSSGASCWAALTSDSSGTSCWVTLTFCHLLLSRVVQSSKKGLMSVSEGRSVLQTKIMIKYI
jgi:hypothetical protein